MTSDGAGEGTRVDEVLLRFAITLGEAKKLLFGLPLVAVVIAVVYSLLVPFRFTAATSFLQPQQQQSTAAIAALQQLGGLAGLAGAATGLRRPEDLYFALLRSERLQDAIIDRFALMQRYQTAFRAEARIALAGNSAISVDRGGLLKVEVTDKDPAFAAQLANAYVEELRKLLGAIAVTEAQQRRAFFEQQLLNAKESLVKAEITLKQTQERTGLIALDRQGQAVIQAAADLRAQIASREVQLQAMRNYATPQNADVQRIAAEINGLKLQLAKLEEGQVRAQGGIVPIGKVPEAGLEYVRAAREVKYHETMFELLARQFELAKADEAREAPLVQQVDIAAAPEHRSSPKRKMIVLTATAVGFVLAVILILLRAALRNARADDALWKQLQVLREAWRITWPRRGQSK